MPHLWRWLVRVLLQTHEDCREFSRPGRHSGTLRSALYRAFTWLNLTYAKRLDYSMATAPLCSHPLVCVLRDAGGIHTPACGQAPAPRMMDSQLHKPQHRQTSSLSTEAGSSATYTPNSIAGLTGRILPLPKTICPSKVRAV